jgi:hypothetical protein
MASGRFIVWIVLENDNSFEDATNAQDFFRSKFCSFRSRQQDGRCVRLEAGNALWLTLLVRRFPRLVQHGPSLGAIHHQTLNHESILLFAAQPQRHHNRFWHSYRLKTVRFGVDTNQANIKIVAVSYRIHKGTERYLNVFFLLLIVCPKANRSMKYLQTTMKP